MDACRHPPGLRSAVRRLTRPLTSLGFYVLGIVECSIFFNHFSFYSGRQLFFLTRYRQICDPACRDEELLSVFGDFPSEGEGRIRPSSAEKGGGQKQPELVRLVQL